MHNPAAEILDGVDSVADTIFDGIDKNWTTKEEEIYARSNAQKVLTDFTQGIIDKYYQFFMAIENNISERHKNDMLSDSTLSKNIRPMFLAFVVFSFLGMVISENVLSSADQVFIVRDIYVQILKEWGAYAIGFYFGGRSLEKGVKAVFSFIKKNEIPQIPDWWGKK